MIIGLFYTCVLVTLLACYMVVPKKTYRKPPSEDSDDEGGDPMDTDLPDLDLPPGISLPINDFEPEYNKPRHRQPNRPELSFF
jgi:hypothetical protein